MHTFVGYDYGELYFSMQDFHRRIVPKNGLDKVIVTDRLAQNLDEIVQFEKARSAING